MQKQHSSTIDKMNAQFDKSNPPVRINSVKQQHKENNSQTSSVANANGSSASVKMEESGRSMTESERSFNLKVSYLSLDLTYRVVC